MKVLLLIDKMDIGGAETHAATLARALKEEGCEVAFLTEGGAYEEQLRNLQIPIFHAPLSKRDLFSVIKSAKRLRALGREGFTVLHAHTRYTAALAAAVLPRTPLVTTVHLDFKITPLQRLLCRWGRCSLAVSEDLAGYLSREYGFPEERIFPTVNGIDTRLFSPLAARGKYILHISRLDKDRSLTAHLLCAIAPTLHRLFPEQRIYIYGTGDDISEIEREAALANETIGRRFVFLCGATTSVFEVLKDAAVLIGVSRAALEGAARAVPVILSGNDGYGGILDEKSFENERFDNFCCRNKEIATKEKLCSDISFLLEHQCFCEKIRHKISGLIAEGYTPKRMARDALCAYAASLSVCVIGYYGFGNLGDEMMKKAITEQLTALGIGHVFPLERIAPKGGIGRNKPFSALWRLRRCDAVILGGGNLLQNETSSASFFYYAAWLLLCRRKTLHAAGIGVGALKGRLCPAVCSRILRRFQSITARTQADARAIEKLCPDIRDRVTVGRDLCFLLAEHPKKTAPRYLLAIPSKAPSEAFVQYLSAKKREGMDITIAVLFPLQDEAAARALCDRFGLEAPILVRSEADYFRLAEGAVSAISERLHGAIFALLSHTPCLLLADSQKNAAFASDATLVATHCGLASPVIPFRAASEALKKEREAEGRTFGFSEIISYFKRR